MDITHLESVQRRATRFIVDDKSMDYRDRLTKLNLLPLMMEYEIADILFFVNSIKTPHGHFDITNYVNFSVSNTRSSTYLKLRHSTSKRNYQGHFYFNRFPRLWNSLPSLTIHQASCQYAFQSFCYRFFFFFFFFLSCSPSSLVAVGFASRPSVQTLLTTLNLSLVTFTSIFVYSVLQSL